MVPKKKEAVYFQLSLIANQMILMTFVKEHLVIMLQQKVIDHTRASHVKHVTQNVAQQWGQKYSCL